MSSYFPSFNYMGYNSLEDKNLIVVHFENGDSGEMDTFLGMDSIYTESAYGTKRIDYGARYNSVALIKISVMKKDGECFTVAEVRDFLKWTTGVKKTSYLDLINQQVINFSFYGRVVNVLQHKLDSKTVGFTIEFESVSPWAYSPEKIISGPTNGKLSIDSNGVLYSLDESTVYFNFNTESQTVYNSKTSDGMLTVSGDGIIVPNTSLITIDNQTDDLYNYVYLNVRFTNTNCTSITIENATLNEKTIINGIRANEIIDISSEHFIISDAPNKIFGNNFNFVWPRLAPGINEIGVDSNGSGHIYMSYRYPIKIGDCAIDIDI